MKIAFLLALFLLGCAGMYTQQNVNQSQNLEPGMSKDRVRNIMGPPVKTEFSGQYLAWHYCRTGYSADEFTVAIFKNDSLVESRNYSVTLSETGGAYGDCSKFVKPVNFTPPDEVKEIRIR